jgi:hypothetical protein
MKRSIRLLLLAVVTGGIVAAVLATILAASKPRERTRRPRANHQLRRQGGALMICKLIRQVGARG